MAIKRPKPEEIVLKLRQVEFLMGQGIPRINAIRQIGVTAFRIGESTCRRVAEMLQKPKNRPRGGLLLSCYLRYILAPAVGIEPTTN